jgi:hypothetical protein
MKTVFLLIKVSSQTIYKRKVCGKGGRASWEGIAFCCGFQVGPR